MKLYVGGGQGRYDVIDMVWSYGLYIVELSVGNPNKIYERKLEGMAVTLRKAKLAKVQVAINKYFLEFLLSF